MAHECKAASWYKWWKASKTTAHNSVASKTKRYTPEATDKQWIRVSISFRSRLTDVRGWGMPTRSPCRRRRRWTSGIPAVFYKWNVFLNKNSPTVKIQHSRETPSCQNSWKDMKQVISRYFQPHGMQQVEHTVQVMALMTQSDFKAPPMFVIEWRIWIVMLTSDTPAKKIWARALSASFILSLV